MATDRRKKGCPNEACERHQNKIMLKASEEFCPKCGTRLIFVCSKCFNEIEDIDSKHKICKLCEAKEQEKKDKAVGGVKKAGKGVAALAVPVIGGIAGGLVKKGQEGAINEGVKFAEKAVKAVLKK